VFYQYDNEQHEQKAKEVLAGLGEFVIAFERVCAEMRSVIHCIYRREGLKNQGLSQVAVNMLTAEGLRTLLGGLYNELRDQDEGDNKQVRALLSRIDKLGTNRNNMLHAEWFLNYDYEGANEQYTARALKHAARQNAGASFLFIPVTRESLDNHIKEATELYVLTGRLATCMNQKGFKVSEMLSKPL
jgi:hypothetical protein